MNFFGHAVVAGWAGGADRVVLGSMLPDFESMTGARVLNSRDADLERGIALHHRTDDAFHGTPVFVALCRRAIVALSASGVRRGTARAVSHIGTEMFLDGILADDESHAKTYLDALAPNHMAAVDWDDGGLAFEKLRVRLERWGAPRDYGDPDFVLDRLQNALRDRPKLRLLDEQRAAVAGFLPRLRAWVGDDSTELLNDLRDALRLTS